MSSAKVCDECKKVLDMNGTIVVGSLTIISKKPAGGVCKLEDQDFCDISCLTTKLKEVTRELDV